MTNSLHDHEHRFRVIYGDTDMMGVVYYANYLRYFETGRNELMREMGFPYKKFEELGFGLPVVDVSVRYKASATYDDLLLLRTRIIEVKRSSLRVDYRLVRPEDDTLVCVGETRHACLSAEGRIVRWPEAIWEKLNGS